MHCRLKGGKRMNIAITLIICMTLAYISTHGGDGKHEKK